MNPILVEQTKDLIEKYYPSQNKASQDIGYSASMLSDYLKGKFKGNLETFEKALTQWIARTKQAHAKKQIPIVETSQLNRIINALSLAHAESDITLIVDDAGGGKTTAARYYTDQNPRTTIYIPVVKGMNAKTLTLQIAEKLGLDTYRINQQALIHNTATALSEKKMLVILDEADYLKGDALEFSRRLVNDLGQSGLALIGLPRLTGTIQNLKNDHRQLESRIGVYLALGGLSKQDAGKIARAVWPDVDKEIIEAIYSVAKTDVRQFTKIMERSQNIMAVNKQDEISLEVVEMAASMVMRRNWR